MKTTFTQGPIRKQLLTMMLASWVAMAANMLLSLVDMFFLSRLNDINVLAAIGFSSAITMIAASAGIGFSVSTSVLVSQKLARQGQQAASSLFSAILAMGAVFSVVLMVVLLLSIDSLLPLLGAKDLVLDNALKYLTLVLMTSPLAVLGMIFAAGLRAAAMAKASMYIALVATVINLILDPLFIEVLGWGIEGAAWATVIARIIAFIVAMVYFSLHLGWLKPVSWAFLRHEFSAVQRITMPVLITNLFTPLGSIIVVKVVAQYGSAAMAGMAVVGSLSPILFSVYFSLTGAAGPMVGQNVGAKNPQRIAAIYRNGMFIILSYSLVIWLLASMLAPSLVKMFTLEGLAAELLLFYCWAQIPLTAGLGIIALSNGIFNNLGKPRWSMWLNVSRSTLATLLLCSLGSWLWGVYGAVLAASLTFTLYGLLAATLAARLFKQSYPQHRLFNPMFKPLISQT